MSSTIRRLGEQFSSDKKITQAEARALVTEVKKNGIVSSAEKVELNRIIRANPDQFEPGALEVLLPLVQTTPPATTGTVKLTRTEEHRPVFLSADGRFTIDAAGAPPRDLAEAGEALFRAGELVDDTTENVLAGLSSTLREKAYQGLLTTLSDAKRLPNDQAIQTRASASTVLLHLMEATKEPELAAKMLRTYEGLARAESFPKLRQSMIFHLANSTSAKSGEAKAIADTLMKELAPVTPPYAEWFKNGNKTVNLDWIVGSEFVSGFKQKLVAGGFKAVGPESSYGPTTYERRINRPGVGETVFRISVRQASATNLFAPLANPGVQIVGYDGHSNWGRNLSTSLRGGNAGTDGTGKLFIANLCVGKGALDRMAEQYPNLQSVTTYGSSSVDTDINMLAEMIASRSGWDAIDAGLQRTSRYEKNPVNFVTPISTLTRERVLDRDNDGQADYLDKHFTYSTFQIPTDTARELAPIRQSRAADRIDGTKILIAGQMINALAEFSTILDKVNHDSKVVTAGWFEPRIGEHDIVRFEKARGPDGKVEHRMTVSARYAHMSEEALRAVALYEWNRFVVKEGDIRLSPVDAKLNGILLLAHSLDTDEASRDTELWSSLLKRFNLPAVPLSAAKALLDAEHHDYSGNTKMVAALKAKLGAEVVRQLERSEVGEPVRLIG